MLTLSASSILNYARCPYSFYLYKTTEREEKPQTKATATGRAFHRLIGFILNGMSFKEALDEVLIDDILADAQELKMFYSVYEEELERLKDEGVLATEKYFELDIDGVIISGYIDIITSFRRLIEMKTTRQQIQAPKPSHIFQVSLYRLTDDADSYELHYISPAQLVKIPVKPYPSSLVLSIVKQVKTLVDTLEYPPLGLVNGYCQYCLYKSLCTYYQKVEV